MCKVLRHPPPPHQQPVISRRTTRRSIGLCLCLSVSASLCLSVSVCLSPFLPPLSHFSLSLTPLPLQVSFFSLHVLGHNLVFNAHISCPLLLLHLNRIVFEHARPLSGKCFSGEWGGGVGVGVRLKTYWITEVKRKLQGHRDFLFQCTDKLLLQRRALIFFTS